MKAYSIIIFIHIVNLFNNKACSLLLIQSKLFLDLPNYDYFYIFVSSDFPALFPFAACYLILFQTLLGKIRQWFYNLSHWHAYCAYTFDSSWFYRTIKDVKNSLINWLNLIVGNSNTYNSQSLQIFRINWSDIWNMTSKELFFRTCSPLLSIYYFPPIDLISPYTVKNPKKQRKRRRTQHICSVGLLFAHPLSWIFFNTQLWVGN